MAAKVVTASELKTDLTIRAQEKLENSLGDPSDRVCRNFLEVMLYAMPARTEPLNNYLARKGDPKNAEEFKRAARGTKNRIAILDRKRGLVLHLESPVPEGQFIELDTGELRI